MSDSDNSNPLDALMEALQSGAEVKTMRVEGNTIEEVISNLHAQAPEGIPAGVLSAMEDVIREKFAARKEGSKEAEAPSVFHHWPTEEAELMFGFLSTFVENLHRYDEDYADDDTREQLLAHMLKCKDWDPERVRPLIKHLVTHSSHVLSSLNTLRTMFHSLATGTEIPTLEDLNFSKEALERHNLADTFPAMRYLTEIMFNHLKGPFTDNDMVKGFLTFTVPHGLVISGKCATVAEAIKQFGLEEAKNVVAMLEADPKLDLETFNIQLFKSDPTQIARTYLMYKAGGVDEAMLANVRRRMSKNVVAILDAAAPLCYGIQGDETAKVLH